MNKKCLFHDVFPSLHQVYSSRQVVDLRMFTLHTHHAQFLSRNAVNSSFCFCVGQGVLNCCGHFAAWTVVEFDSAVCQFYNIK